MEINLDIAKKVLETVDAGLVQGMGKPIPGKMCVEAAVCYAMGLPHSDEPTCVSPAIRQLKIKLNDSNWSSNEARAKGMRRLALAQLGSAGVVDDRDFAKRVATLAIKVMVPLALRAAADIQKDPDHRQKLRDAANRCEVEGSLESAQSARSVARAYAAAAAAAAAAANANAYAAAAAAAAADAAANANADADAKKRDEGLSLFAEGAVQVLIDMNAPGVQWLILTE